MINFYNQVPSVYNNASRDFQFLSWLINIVLNSVKHNVDDLYELPNAKADTGLAELLAMTLGFKVKRNYNQKQLLALVSIIPSILKYKGTKKAVELACQALIKSSGAIGAYSIDIRDNCIEVLLPEDLVDIVLFTDLLPYILPAGISVKIVTQTVVGKTIDKINVGLYDVPIAEWVPDLAWDAENIKTKGISGLFEDSTQTTNTPEFTNFKRTDGKILNVGLLDNTIIPLIQNQLVDNKTSGLSTASSAVEVTSEVKEEEDTHE